MTSERDLRLANLMPLHLLGRDTYLDTFFAKDAPEFSVICLASDSMSSVLARARRYPGWVEIIVAEPGPSSGDETKVDVTTRQILPKEFDPENQALHDRFTIGFAFRMLLSLERRGVDVFLKEASDADERQLALELVGGARSS